MISEVTSEKGLIRMNARLHIFVNMWLSWNKSLEWSLCVLRPTCGEWILYCDTFLMYLPIVVIMGIRSKISPCNAGNVCVFISFHPTGHSWLSKTINIMLEMRSAMACWGNISVSRTFVVTSEKIITGTFKLATVRKSVN